MTHLESADIKTVREALTKQYSGLLAREVGVSEALEALTRLSARQSAFEASVEARRLIDNARIRIEQTRNALSICIDLIKEQQHELERLALAETKLQDAPRPLGARGDACVVEHGNAPSPCNPDGVCQPESGEC